MVLWVLVVPALSQGQETTPAAKSLLPVSETCQLLYTALSERLEEKNFFALKTDEDINRAVQQLDNEGYFPSAVHREHFRATLKLKPWGMNLPGSFLLASGIESP